MTNRFSERVKILMNKHGWSMRDLSRQSGIPYSTIYDVLLCPTAKNGMKLADQISPFSFKMDSPHRLQSQFPHR